MRPQILIPILFLVSSGAIAGSTPNLNDIAFEQKPGAKLPLENAFHDDEGRVVYLSNVFEGRPLILVLGYFRCAKLCSIVRADLSRALETSGMVAGRDYSVLAVSIDSSESAVEARAARANDLENHSSTGARDYWRFVTGDKESIEGVAQAVGLKSSIVGSGDSFAHPTGIVFVSPKEIVSSYLLGVGYQPEELRRAVIRAAVGDASSPVSPVMLLCYDFDATTGRYTLAIIKLFRWTAALTTLLVGCALFHAFRQERTGA